MYINFSINAVKFLIFWKYMYVVSSYSSLIYYIIIYLNTQYYFKMWKMQKMNYSYLDLCLLLCKYIINDIIHF